MEIIKDLSLSPEVQEAGKWILTAVGQLVCTKIKERLEKRKLEKVKKGISFNEYTNISDFWKTALNGELYDEETISIQGQLSKYTPMMIGPPMLKRQLHLNYRRRLQKGLSPHRESQIHASLSYSAGQMVWRLNWNKQPLMFLGLFHSIVRNSIPVFVDLEYYRKSVDELFNDNINPFVIEAEIKGEVIEFEKGFLDENPDANLLKGAIRLEILEPLYGIIVDGKNTTIKYVDEARYLDGDIWVGLQDKEKQFFVSRFIDLADIDDLQNEKELLRKDVEGEEYKNAKIISQFDQVQKLFPMTSKIDDILARLTS